jgi:hypothetical protein
MALECARDSLLKKTMDNKENTGKLFSQSHGWKA